MNFKEYKKKRSIEINNDVNESYEIGNLITKARIEKNIPQKKLADELGVASSTLSKIENGHRDCKIRELRRIAHALGKELKISFVDPEEENDK